VDRLAIIKGNEKGAAFNFYADPLSCVVGRSAGCDLQVTDSLLSRRHFRVTRQANVFTLVDLDSHNGTFANGQPVQNELVLRPGDEIRAGETVFRFVSQVTITPARSNAGPYTGHRIGGYQVEEKIGSGGMGEVYKATQLSMGRTVALKILASQLAQNSNLVQKFVSEARNAGRLDHPNIIHVHEVGQQGNVYYYSMEYADGGSVQDLIRGGRKLDAEKALAIIVQAAQALAYAEGQRIVHCDVKPDNLMMTKGGEVLLADLGISRRLVAGSSKANQDSGVFGSPHYIAPEQAAGKPIDNRADIYSLGVTFYRLLAGRTPFQGRDPKEIMKKHLNEEPLPLSGIDPTIPGLVAQIIEKMMQKNPRHRYQSARACLRDLVRAREGRGAGRGRRSLRGGRSSGRRFGPP